MEATPTPDSLIVAQIQVDEEIIVSISTQSGHTLDPREIRYALAEAIAEFAKLEDVAVSF